MEHPILTPNLPTQLSLKPPTIKPIPLIYSLKNSFQGEGMNPKKICIDRIKFRRYGKLETPPVTGQYDVSNKFPKRFERMMKAQKSLSRIFASFSSLQSLNKAKIWLFPRLKNVKSLKSLSFDSSVLFPFRLFKSLFMSLGALKKFKKFIISIKLEEIQDDKVFRSGIKFLQRIKTLVSISVSLKASRVPPVPISRSQAFSSHLKKLTQLRALEVKVFGLEDLEPYIDHLTFILLSLPQLTRISLKFPESTTLLNSSLRKLFVSLQSLESLTSLKLKLFYRPGFQENDFRPFSEYLGYLNCTQFQELNLKFYGAYDEKKLVRLSQALKNFTSLQHLRLHFSKCCRIKEWEMSQFAIALKGLVQLQTLDLYFFAPYTNEFIIQNITYALSSLVNISTLKLSFVYNITAPEDDMDKLFWTLRRLKVLESLDLFFGDKNLITEDELETLRQSLNELLLLKSLNLTFINSSPLTHKGMERLARGVETLKNLRDLRLRFGYLYQTCRRNSKMLGEALQNLPVLTSFTFHFCEFFWRRENDPSDLADFFTGLAQIKNPMEIILRFPQDETDCQEAKDLLKVKHLVVKFIPL